MEDPAKLDTLTARYTETATQFVRASKGSPFFLYMPHTFPHIPLAASARFRGKSPQGLYGDVVEELDWSVGEVLRTLKEEGREKDTLVMFSSDNGPWYQGSPGRLRGRKGSTYEGGVREPFLARWPGKIPRGKTTPALASLMDVFPTVTKLCGGKLPAAAAGWDRHVAAARRWPGIRRSAAVAVFQRLEFAVRALEKLEAAHGATQYGRLFARASWRCS